MNVASTNLLKVQTLSLKLAKQIQVLQDTSMKLTTEVDNLIFDGLLEVLGWVKAETIFTTIKWSADIRLLLVKHEQQFWWFAVDHKIIESRKNPKMQKYIPQLFIS